MRKIIKKWGDSFIITISPEDMKIYGLSEGEIIDFDVMKVKIQKEVKHGTQK
jgi:antitoxin component of MazEF toxin-antitoxin module